MSDGAPFWTELLLRVAPEVSELVADLLHEITGNGVTIEPPIQALGPDEGYVLDPKAPDTLKAYVYGPVAEPLRRELDRRLADAGLSGFLVGEPVWNTVREEDWAEAWKAHYDVEKVGRVVVRPLWRDYDAQPGEVVINLDPGMAFGTGQHPTTRMCLEALQEQGTRNGEKGPGRVLDLGSGSGILAIAAAALGADWVLAVDTEEQAVKMTRENVLHNAMADRIETRAGSIEAVAEDGPFDVILANINAAAVASLAIDMASQLKAGGWLAAGGVIQEREAMARDALQAAGLRIEGTMKSGDWRTLIARR
jgi:ribosomal protein L11 methyltransferase